MKRGYDPKILEKAYKVGNIVYVLDTATGHVVNSSLERTRGNSKIKKKSVLFTRLHCAEKL